MYAKVSKKITLGDGAETPPEAFRELLEHIYLPANTRVVWDPYVSTGRSKQFLSELLPECVVYNEVGTDCYSWRPPLPVDVIITNPPFSTLRNEIKFLLSLNVPFAMLMREGVVFNQYLHQLFIKYGDDLCIFAPKSRISYFHPTKNEQIRKPHFVSVWLVYKLRLRAEYTHPMTCYLPVTATAAVE